MLATAVRYWYTLRHLKPVQFYGRVRFRIKPPIDMHRLPSRQRPATGRWEPPAGCAPSLTGSGEFELLGQRYSLPASGGWDDPRIDKLRRYNLHYFDDLNAIPRSAGADWHGAWIMRWIDENPPGEGTGWEPYPASLRIVNWIKWLVAGGVAPDGMIASLALQARVLSRRLEWHLLGNHLFANAKALAFAGLYFEGDEADRWLAAALTIFETEFDEQLLPDGGQFELSPMYHAIFVGDVLDLINADRLWPGRVPDSTAARWRDAVPGMLRFLDAMSHPDGEIALFNDAAIGIAPNLEALAGYARRLGLEAAPVTGMSVIHLADSGYMRLSAGRAVAVLDVARVGPDYLPGHAHADTLSFELSLGQTRVIVNGGTSEYGLGPVRLFERGTAAHSTVEVNGQNSSEVWSGFRVARRARPFGLKVEQGAAIAVECAHDGYRRLAGQPVPKRRWELDARRLRVTDTVEGRHDRAVARFILAPDISIAPRPMAGFSLERDGETIADVEIRRGTATIAPAHHAPHFGTRLETVALEVLLDGGCSEIEFTWR